MPRTALSVQQPGLAGATPSYAAVDATNGNSFVWAGVPVLIHAKNTGGSPSTMTVQDNGAKLGGLSLQDPTLTIPATTGDKMLAIKDPAGLVQADGSIYLDWSVGSGVVVGIFRLE
jgi:hypothetical protein